MSLADKTDKELRALIDKAYRNGAREMRERCAQAMLNPDPTSHDARYGQSASSSNRLPTIIRAVPLPKKEGKDATQGKK